MPLTIWVLIWLKTLAYRDVSAPDFTVDQRPSDPDIKDLHGFGRKANLQHSRSDPAGGAGRNPEQKLEQPQPRGSE